MRKWVIVGAAVATALCAGAPVAVAAPAGGYAVFNQCAVHAIGVEGCLYGQVDGGYFTLGKATVPIVKPVVLQGGFVLEGEPAVQRFVPALDGETLTKVAQPVPDALGLSVSAVAEVAGPASSITFSEGLVEGHRSLTLPVELRLVNPLLGVECSIGSSLHPIEMNMTTGATSGGLTGSPGEKTTTAGGRILVISGMSMVSRGFSVPKASGCGSAFIDEVIDTILGLPASRNTAVVLDMKIEQASVYAVEESGG